MDSYTDSSESDGRSDNEGGHSLQGYSKYNIVHNFALICRLIFTLYICRYTYADTWVFRRGQKNCYWWAIVLLHNSKKIVHPQIAAGSQSWTSTEVCEKLYCLYYTHFKSCYCRDGDIPRAVLHKALTLKCMLLCVLCTKFDNLIQIQLRILAAQPMKNPYGASMNCKTVKETYLPENPWPLGIHSL